MSKVGRREITIPANVTVTIAGTKVIVQGPKGTLEKTFSSLMEIKSENGVITVKRANEDKQTMMLHGTTNSLIQGMVIGVTSGFVKELEIIGIGYRVELKDKILTFSLGLSHKIELKVPHHLKVEVPKNTSIIISGIDKQQVGEFAAKIKSFKKPEPYGGKGIRYKGEFIRRKAGKAAQ